jgi:hypothetical protein
MARSANFGTPIRYLGGRPRRGLRHFVAPLDVVGHADRAY